MSPGALGLGDRVECSRRRVRWAEEEVCVLEQSGAIHDPAVLMKCVAAIWVHSLPGTPEELPKKH